MRYLILVAAGVCAALAIYGFISHNFYGAVIGFAMSIVNLINYGSYLKNSHEANAVKKDLEIVKVKINGGLEAELAEKLAKKLEVALAEKIALELKEKLALELEEKIAKRLGEEEDK